MSLRTAFAIAALTSLPFAAAPLRAAPPEVPTGIVYQGVLLDSLGAPRTGNVDLTARIFDAQGSGNLLYVQKYLGVGLDQGAFSVVLGPTGAASDGAATPLTTDLAVVFGGDLPATAPERWLELQVGTSTALARTRLQAAPFALRAGSAETADTAAFATEAGTAANTTGVGGIPADVLTQIWDHTNLDGKGPNNSDPIEGLADPDGDGVANFLDPDNDDDGLDDSVEIAQGTNPNLVTPRITAIQPASGLAFAVTHVTVTGQSFEPGLTATLGAQALAPQNVLPGSFEADAGPQSSGQVGLIVTNANGEGASLANAFLFADAYPHGLAANAQSPLTVSVQGTDQVLVAGAGGYALSEDTDFTIDASFPLSNVEGITTRWDPTGRVMGLRCAGGSSFCNVHLIRDADGDFDLEDETFQVLESIATNRGMRGPSLAFDPSGHTVAAYFRKVSSNLFVPVVLHDLDGDGAFGSAGERTELASLSSSDTPTRKDEVAVDSAGRVAFVYLKSGAGEIHVLYDRNGDGDFADVVGSTSEEEVIAASPACLGAGFDGDGHLTLVYTDGSSTVLARDLNDDGVPNGTGETTSLPLASACDVASGPGVPLAVAYREGQAVRLVEDLNDDGDFADANESRLFVVVNAPTVLSLAYGSSGKPFIATQSELVVTP
jgi:hypothetical protein